MSTPSPPRRVSDETHPEYEGDYQGDYQDGEFGSTSTNPSTLEYENQNQKADSGNGGESNQNDSYQGGESRNPDDGHHSPQRVLSPSDDRRENVQAKRHPYPRDETQLKTILNLKKDRLMQFFKNEMNENLVNDFMQLLEENIELKDSEIYAKLREFLIERGHTFQTVSAERCYGSKASEILSVLPKKNFTPESLVHIFCEEGNILSSLKEAFPSLTTVIGADSRDIRKEENRDKFEFVQFQDQDPFKIDGIKDECADVVVLTMRLFNYENQYAILDELKRIMKRGAFLVIHDFDCTRDDARLFNDVVNGFYSSVFSDPMLRENFCSTYKAYYKSKSRWEGFLERKSLYSFKDSPTTGFFRTYYASFKKDVSRGSSSRKRGLLNQNRGPMPYGMNPYGMNIPNQGPPFKRRRFNNPPPSNYDDPSMRGGFSSGRGGRGNYSGRGFNPNFTYRNNTSRPYNTPPNLRNTYPDNQNMWNPSNNMNGGMWNNNANWNNNQMYGQQGMHSQHPMQHNPQGQMSQPLPQSQYMYNQPPRYNSGRGSRNFQYQQSDSMNYQQNQSYGNTSFQDQQFNS